MKARTNEDILKYCSDYSLVDNEFYFDRSNSSYTKLLDLYKSVSGILGHSTPSLTFTGLASFILQMKCVSSLSGKHFYWILKFILFKFKGLPGEGVGRFLFLSSCWILFNFRNDLEYWMIHESYMESCCRWHLTSLKNNKSFIFLLIVRSSSLRKI